MARSHFKLASLYRHQEWLVGKDAHQASTKGRTTPTRETFYRAKDRKRIKILCGTGQKVKTLVGWAESAVLETFPTSLNRLKKCWAVLSVYQSLFVTLLEWLGARLSIFNIPTRTDQLAWFQA
jgi:hypothetical protein